MLEEGTQPSDVCPYCGGIADTDDHLFPEFLGGRATVPACSNCNNARFGAKFEARVSRMLEPFLLILRHNGLKPLSRRSKDRPFVWRKAYREPSTGEWYDIDDQMTLTPSQPRPRRNRLGQIVAGTFRTRKELEQFRKSLGPSTELRVEARDSSIGQPQLAPFTLAIAGDLRRLATKVCVALAAKHGRRSAIGDQAIAYLLDEGVTHIPVRFASQLYFDVLDAQRPPLGHLAYVEAAAGGRVYGIVQFFGAIQLYVELGNRYTGVPFALLHSVDVLNRQEDLREIQPLLLPEAPLHIKVSDMPRVRLGLMERLNSEMTKAFGEPKMTIKIPASEKEREEFARLTVADVQDPADPVCASPEFREIAAKLVFHIEGEAGLPVFDGKAWDAVELKFRRFDMLIEDRNDDEIHLLAADVIERSALVLNREVDLFAQKLEQCSVRRGMLIASAGFEQSIGNSSPQISRCVLREVSKPEWFSIENSWVRKRANLKLDAIEFDTLVELGQRDVVGFRFADFSRPQMSAAKLAEYIIETADDNPMRGPPGHYRQRLEFVPPPILKAVLADADEVTVSKVRFDVEFDIIASEPQTRYWELCDLNGTPLVAIGQMTLGESGGQPLTAQIFAIPGKGNKSPTDIRLLGEPTAERDA